MDIAVDPLEGTNLVASGAPNAICVLAASEPGGLMHAPDTYLRKLVVGPGRPGHVSINDPVAVTGRPARRAPGPQVSDVTVVVLDRPRHESSSPISGRPGPGSSSSRDGDLTAGISAAVSGTGVHAVMGIGGAPEGVLPPPP